MATDDYVGFTFSVVGDDGSIGFSSFYEFIRQQVENINLGFRFDYFHRCCTLLVHATTASNAITNFLPLYGLDFNSTVCVLNSPILAAVKKIDVAYDWPSVVMLVTGY